MTKPESAIDLIELNRRQRDRDGYTAKPEETTAAGVYAIRVTEHPLDIALSRAVIDQRLWDAGDRLRAAYHGAQTHAVAQYDGVPAPPTMGPKDTTIRQQEAAAEYAMAMRAVGKWQGSILTRFCGLGHAVDEIFGGGTRWHKARAWGKLIASLEGLADHFGY
jgi:hypothetical protein